MRRWMHRSLCLILVVALILPGGIGALATEPDATEYVASESEETAPEQTEAVETVPEETVIGETLPEETIPEETAIEETIPEETAPEETEPKTYTVDTESDMYKVLAALEPELKSDQIMVYDATDDKMLYTMTTEGDKLYPASITKLFSAYVALQHLDPEEVLTVGDELSLVQPGSSVAYLARGQQLYVRTVVEAMMLPSGNDAAMVLAAAAGRRIAEDESLDPEDAVQTFVAEMNAKAKELGFERSHFANPDGFHLGCHYTCLNDMARIAKLALEDKTISRYIRRYKDEVTFVSGHYIEWENTNLLLNPDEGFYRSDAIGMKTGFTRQAEYCLMSAFKCSDGRIIVVGAFGSDDEYDRLRDILKLINVCKDQLKIEEKAK